jgi:hypothetical protein
VMTCLPEPVLLSSRRRGTGTVFDASCPTGRAPRRSPRGRRLQTAGDQFKLSLNQIMPDMRNRGRHYAALLTGSEHRHHIVPPFIVRGVQPSKL